ncbi:DUF5723 family protein [Aquimarina longa]|uniref:DUF5723 family protein n=1 Tax=Aquimarina longa TaxID=1080221 RepID=UPI000B2505E8|nr:DUF5723 family protein [Aquimarina longa]
MRFSVFLLMVLWGVFMHSQNKELLYDFTDLPQSLISNPGTDVKFDYHLGVPFLSHFHLNVGLRGASLYDVFADDDRSINDKIAQTLHKLTSNDYITITQQLALVDFGWRSKKNDKMYFSGGIYQELDVIGYFPKDFAVLAYQGNQDFLNQPFRFSSINGSSELLAIYHFGYTKKINKKLTFGARAKLYSSMFHIRSAKNKGTFTTVETPQGNNTYQHVIRNADVTVRTSGYRSLKDLEQKEVVDKLIGKALLGGNLGLGVDLGFTHKINKQLVVTGSVNDLGVIVYTKDVETYQARGNYIFEGFETPIQFSGRNPQNFFDELKKALSLDTLSTTYIAMRPLKLNGSMKYSFNRYDDGTCECFQNGEQPPYMDAFGAQLFMQFRPKRPQYAASLFYYKRLSNFLRTKVAYTIDDYSYFNIGFLMSIHINKINFYLSANNLLEYANLAKARGISLQLGFNVIM